MGRDRENCTGTDGGRQGQAGTDGHPTLSKSMRYVAIIGVLNTLARDKGLGIKDTMFGTARPGLTF